MLVKILLWVFVCAGAAIGGLGGGGWLASPLLFLPAMGRALRALSLSGNAGNILCWALYLILSLAPLLGLLPAGRRRGWPDLLFGCASAYSLWFWYIAINPTLLTAPAGFPGAEEVAVAMAGGLLILLLAGALLLRVGGSREQKELLSGVSALLAFFCCLSAFSMGLCGASSIRAAVAGEARIEWFHQGALLLCELARQIPLILTLLSARALIRGMRCGWFADENAALADTLSRRSRLLLLSCVLTGAASAACSLLLLGRVAESSVVLDLPLTELLAALSCVLLSRFVADGIRIRQENDQFI